MNPRMAIRVARASIPVATAVLVAGIVAGCGAAGSTASSGGPISQAQLKTEWISCMSRHGVTIPAGAGASQQNLPGYQAAYQACRSILARATVAPGQQQADQRFMNQILRYTRCMRAHGVNLPDPQVRGVNASISQQAPLGPNDPRVAAAQAACRPDLPAGATQSGGGH